MINEVARHYDLLIGEGNDPVLDTPELAAYMDGWDGPAFIDALRLDGTQDVLEIGVGTGRLALRVVDLCRTFTGVDISEKTITRAAEHLAEYPQVQLVCADFLAWETPVRFDVIYASLTFQHFADKRAAVQKVAQLLKPGGRTVISLDKDASGVIDYGTRVIPVFPDDPAALAALMEAGGLSVQSVLETAFAHIIMAVKEVRG